MAYKQVGYGVTSSSTTAVMEPGTIIQDGATGKAYRYVLIEDAAVANGDVVEYSDTSGYEVTKDRAGGASIGRVVAGVAVSTVADGSYGFIQVSGKHSSVKTAGDITTGAVMIPHATYDGKATIAVDSSSATGTDGQRFAFSLAADDTSASTARVVADIRCL